VPRTPLARLAERPAERVGQPQPLGRQRQQRRARPRREPRAVRPDFYLLDGWYLSGRGRSRDAFDRAGEHARALRHNYIGTEHVLLAFATAQRGVAVTVLRDLGVTGDRIRATSCMQAGSDERSAHECLSVMPRLKQSLEHGRRIADELELRLADTEHLLAGIVAVTDSMAVAILRRLGVTVADVRAALAQQLDVEPHRLGAPRRRRRRLRVVAG